MRRLKILLLQPDYHENSHNWSDLVEQIVQAFDPVRYEMVTAFLHGHPDPGDPETRASRAVYFDFPPDWSRGLRLRMGARLREFLAEEKFDVVICNRYKPVNMLMGLSLKLEIPLCIGISHSLGEYDRVWRRFRFRRLVRPNWRFVGVSDAVKDYLIGLNCGFSADNTVAIQNAIDIDRAVSEQFSREEARERLGLPAHARIVGAAGRLVAVKAYDVLIRAFASVAEDYPDALLAIAGEGKKRGELEALIVELNLQERVRLLGFIAGVKRYTKAFDIWTMPSYKEGLGLALLEGMAGGLPVIASDVPAMRALVEGARGRLVRPGNVDDLAAALDAYLRMSDDELRTAGELSFRYVSAAHPIDRYRSQYRALVEEGLGPAERGSL
ncbi:glycosyltransferase [Pseudothauera nasutitermitis]|uniref:Glycosyltransferase n=1 Tax=Pseudothauera nasutitermitis TaxID=2565930 RepID=A0A4S4ATX7_9RHOO|nr:glycosyltransferase [Pseudothauera nasutitermitis]